MRRSPLARTERFLVDLPKNIQRPIHHRRGAVEHSNSGLSEGGDRASG